MPFAALGLSPRTTGPLERLGYATPTPVQAETIPPALQGRDVLARAQTGTGKTAAFGLPMIERLQAVIGASVRPRGLVLVPTRELALQVHDALRSFGQGTRLRGMTLVGGEPIMPQVRTLTPGPRSSTTIETCGPARSARTLTDDEGLVKRTALRSTFSMALRIRS